MRRILFINIILTFVFSSCLNQSIEKSNNRNKEVNENQILGGWRLYETRLESISILCNVCPKVFFDSSGECNVTYSNEKEIYEWKLNLDDSLTLTPDLQGKSIIKKGTYKVNYKKYRTYLELQLYSQNHNNGYVLRKSKK